jgi:hypothetical protein
MVWYPEQAFVIYALERNRGSKRKIELSKSKF